MKTTSPAYADLERRLERLGLSGKEGEWADRYLMCDHLMDPLLAGPRQRFEAVARFIRDLLSHRWVKTRRAREQANPKRIYYLSLEYLIGRTLNNNIMNLGADPVVQSAMESEGWSLPELLDEEPDAGLGNGGLGRLAACFIDSLATLQYSAIGYGLRYEYGIFRQAIRDGYQVEQPDNWLRSPDPWEVARPAVIYPVPLHGSFELKGSAVTIIPDRPSMLLGMAYDRPVAGYGAHCVNTLRLWAAAAPESFDFAEFSHGDFAGAVIRNVAAESVTRVLYPDDSTEAGRTLRFLQQYFMVSCSLQDIVHRFEQINGSNWQALPDHVAIQLNDTHPAITVAELMRILLDRAFLTWEQAWDITVRTLAYTNHTLLPEALETWPVELFERLVPRHLEIIYEINRRFLDEVRRAHPGDEARTPRMSIIQETPSRKVRMAHLAVVGTHSTNGVAEIHTRLLRTRLLNDFAELFPERFNNKTNGVTPRRWLLTANPGLAELISDAIGDAWITDLEHLAALKPLASDRGFLERFRCAKRSAKIRFTDWLRSTTGQIVDPDTIFDSQIKRIHEYKRQLLNVLHIVVLYNRLRRDPGADFRPRTFFFAGKAAPAYHLAKRIIKLINSVAETVSREPATRGRLQVVFLPDYNVTLAERLIPATDVSEQISTAGYEASGTSNMKLMMNGALTVGTRDGATIEMAAAAGEENFFLFGLTAEQVAESRGWYNPYWHYWNEPETREALELIFSGHFSPQEPGVFGPIREALLTNGDFYMHLADLGSYLTTQARASALYGDPEAWAHKAVINVACSGSFSSDRTIAEYAAEIWNAKPSPVP
ncbi:MAG TPA: glycogen/starch/alpha-glucan phosphorylase [Candidatus Saccharimonadales bacterium]|nr:glycogen/starch/alpha-glucan phosphorylase [Candidatus Saccharimonadales bacterium]